MAASKEANGASIIQPPVAAGWPFDAENIR